MRQPPEKSATGRSRSAGAKPRPASRVAARERARVAVDGLEPRVRLGEAVAVVRAASASAIARSTARSSTSPSSTNSTAGCGSGGVSWLDGGDAPVARHQAVAGLGVQFAAQQREQARLAAAVRADEADPPAGVELQVGVLDQAAGAAGERELPELDQGDGPGGAGRAF